MFIYLTERQAAREGTQAGGVGEEEAGSQPRSLMWGSIPERRDHALSRRPTPSDCATPASPPEQFFKKFMTSLGRLGGTAVKRLPSAQGVILAFRDRVPHRAPPLGACFFLSHSPCLCSLSHWLSLSLSNK